MTGARLRAWAISGIPEVIPGDDLAALIGDAIERAGIDEPDLRVADGDILSVTSKVVSKAEGRVVIANDREDAITAESVRLVASREHPGGVTRIVENRLGIVAAAAGVDSSNTPRGTVLLLPVDPDASARRIRAALQDRFGVRLGVVVTDTLGRPWRTGQTDVAIGAAGVRVVSELRGIQDSAGRELAVTAPAIGDEIAALTDLVKGKTSGCPVAVVRGLAHYVTSEEGTGARVLLRDAATDLFRQGSAEAYADGFAAGIASTTAGRAEPADGKSVASSEATGASASG